MLVAFGAEHGAAASSASAACSDDKNVDLVVYNESGVTTSGSTALDNEVTLCHRRRRAARAEGVESCVAGEVLDEVERLLIEKRG